MCDRLSLCVWVCVWSIVNYVCLFHRVILMTPSISLNPVTPQQLHTPNSKSSTDVECVELTAHSKRKTDAAVVDVVHTMAYVCTPFLDTSNYFLLNFHLSLPGCY